MMCGKAMMFEKRREQRQYERREKPSGGVLRAEAKQLESGSVIRAITMKGFYLYQRICLYPRTNKKDGGGVFLFWWGETVVGYITDFIFQKIYSSGYKAE